MGVIRLEGRALVSEPPDSKLLHHIIQSSITVILEGTLKEFRAHDEPELFLKYLHLAYNGPYLHATSVES